MKKYILFLLLAAFTIMLVLAEEEKTGETEQHAYAGVKNARCAIKAKKRE